MRHHRLRQQPQVGRECTEPIRAQPDLLRATLAVNQHQRGLVVKKLQERLRVLHGRRVCLLGLAFKPGTDDTRDAPGVEIARQLLAKGALVTAHDPAVGVLAELPDLGLAVDAYQAADQADASVLITDWPQFLTLDYQGRIVGFGARSLDGSEPKYLNSPESPVYQKSKTLYGLSWAKDAIRREGRVVLMEGYLDVARALECGVEEVVATCGTALTAAHARLLRRFSDTVVVNFDQDDAGIFRASHDRGREGERGPRCLGGPGSSYRKRTKGPSEGLGL